MRFIQGIDYGPRKGTLGFVIHMTEGNGGIGDALYLAKRAGETVAQWKVRVRGVSANFVILNDGEVIQMVAWGNASGSMNPSDRSDNTGFYQQKYIAAVLGQYYFDPNAYSISVEIAGKRANGPTQAQVKATIALYAEARRRYPSLRGAYGHADQTDTKGCPGTHGNMLAIWSAIGHGLYVPPQPPQPEEPMSLIYSVVGRQSAVAPAGTVVYADATGVVTRGKTGSTRRFDLVGKSAKTETDTTRFLVDGGDADDPSGLMGWIEKSALSDWESVDTALYNVGVAAAAAAAAKAKR
jgi:hypothetical protein